MSETEEMLGRGAASLEALVTPGKLRAHDAAFDKLESTCGLAPGLVDGLKSDALALRLTGFPKTDAMNLEQTLAESADLAAGTPDNFAVLKSGQYFQALSRAERRMKTTFSMRDPASAALYHRYATIWDKGCYHDPAIYQAAVSHRLLYYYEGLPVYDLPSMQLLDDSEALTLFADDTPDDPRTNEGLIFKVRGAMCP